MDTALLHTAILDTALLHTALVHTVIVDTALLYSNSGHSLTSHSHSGHSLSSHSHSGHRRYHWVATRQREGHASYGLIHVTASLPPLCTAHMNEARQRFPQSNVRQSDACVCPTIEAWSSKQPQQRQPGNPVQNQHFIHTAILSMNEG